MVEAGNWHQRIGNQRDWVWRGWQVRYTYMRAKEETRSAKTPLILLHGFGASIEHWRKNIPVLSRQQAVYALDLLGFGGSRKAATNYSTYLWVELVYDFWQTFIRHPVVLVGNSIGSLVAMAAAAASHQHPAFRSRPPMWTRLPAPNSTPTVKRPCRRLPGFRPAA